MNKVDQNWEACAERGEAGGWDPAVLRGREVHLRCLGGTGLGLTPEGGLHRPQRPRRREHLEFGFIRCIQTALNILLVSQELKPSATAMSFPLLL